MDPVELQNIHARVYGFGATHKVWVLPILRALETLGGKATPKQVREHIRKTYATGLTELQWAYIVKNGRINWTRLGLRQVGLITGERGTWELTDTGRAYSESHRDDEVVIPKTIPELGVGTESEGADDEAVEPTETVPATDYEAYEYPLLESMAANVTAKQELLDAVGERVKGKLLPGDYRNMRHGRPAWRYRASWALSMLKQKGHAKNTARGVWEVTEAGRERLAKEKASWDPSKYRTSSVSVLAGAAAAPPPPPEPSDQWTLATWAKLRDDLGPTLFEMIDQRIRPDLTPSPARERDYVPRSIILYGPPGTGKTHVARSAALALTGDAEPGPDSRWRIVQFHPSYAYEDFIQGLKPDLEQTKLRYVLRRGPFLELCQAAEEDPDHFYVLVIDEINRGDPARIFGELLYALEYRGQPVDLPLGGQLTVPPNLVLIGTMNSVDRSVALVDYALRRRFGFIRLQPDPDVILSVRGTQAAGQPAAAALIRFNDWLVTRLDQDHALGHSFFLNPGIPLDGPAALKRIWELDVQPLLEEYFFGDLQSLDEARRVWNDAVKQAFADMEEGEDENTTPEPAAAAG